MRWHLENKGSATDLIVSEKSLTTLFTELRSLQ